MEKTINSPYEFDVLLDSGLTDAPPVLPARANRLTGTAVTIEALKRYGLRAYDDVAKNSNNYGKELCGYTFHPGLFRIHVVKGFYRDYSRHDFSLEK